MARHGENIRKRTDGRWEGRYKVFHERKGKYVYRSVYDHTYEGVKEKLSRARLGLLEAHTGMEGTNAGCAKRDTKPHTTVLFSRAAQEWLAEIAEKRKYSTYVKYESMYRTHLAGRVGTCRLSGSAPLEIQEKISDHLNRERLSQSLQKSICCIVNQILSYANKKYAINVPTLEKMQIKQKGKPIHTFSKAEQGRLLSGIFGRPNPFHAALLLCLHTGLRLGELCALRWSDFDFKGMSMTVNRTVQRIAVQNCQTKTILLESPPKSESSKRTIPLTDQITKFLIPLKDRQPYVFGGEKPMEPRTMQYRFKKLLDEMKVDGRNFHILRHTFATNCVENGMDVKALSEILGHSDVKITMNRYVHPTMESKRKQMERLPHFYGQILGQVS